MGAASPAFQLQTPNESQVTQQKAQGHSSTQDQSSSQQNFGPGTSENSRIKNSAWLGRDNNSLNDGASDYQGIPAKAKKAQTPFIKNEKTDGASEINWLHSSKNHNATVPSEEVNMRQCGEFSPDAMPA